MSTHASTKIDQKEYLRKYLSGDKVKKKKKDKKHKSKLNAAKVKIIDDDDCGGRVGPEIDEALLYGGDDAPQIVAEYIETENLHSLTKWRSFGVKVEELNDYPEAAPGEAQVRIKSEPIDGETAAALKRVIKEERVTPPPGAQRLSTPDNSPPRRRRSDDDDNSPPRRRRPDDDDNSPPRRRRPDDDDNSPPRRRRRSNSAEAERKGSRQQRDLSPARRKRGRDQSPPRRRHDRRSRSGDQSPRRCDESPPRRRRYSNDQSPPRRKRQSSDQSPPRRRRQSNDQSPPRRNRVRSRTPTRVKQERRTTPEPSPAPRVSRFKQESLSPPPTHKPKASKTLDGKKAGLQDAASLRTEMEERRRKETAMYEQMSSSISGRDAEIQVRSTGRRGKRARDAEAEDPEVRRRKEEREKEKKDLYDRWGKGLKQIEQHRAQLEQHEYESSKPLARYTDDADLERHLREQERIDDPMLAYIREKKREKEKERPQMPVYVGNFPENRFGIRPGYRWDGVDRSNGYEDKWFNVQNEKRALQEEAYKYSVEDM